MALTIEPRTPKASPPPQDKESPNLFEKIQRGTDYLPKQKAILRSAK